MRRSKRIRNSPHQYNPRLGAAREWKNDHVSSIAYIIQDGYLNRNVDTYELLSLPDDWYEEDCMDAPSTLRMREYYVLKYEGHDPDTPAYM